MTAIEVDHLSKRFGAKVAVDDVSFAVAEGEIFGLLGRNGAGKSTTVDCVAGLRAPDRGRIRVTGLDPRRDRGELRHLLGVQLQESGLPDKLTVAEVMRLYASFYRHPADTDGLLATLDLTEKRNTRYRRQAPGGDPGRAHDRARSRRQARHVGDCHPNQEPGRYDSAAHRHHGGSRAALRSGSHPRRGPDRRHRDPGRTRPATLEDAFVALTSRRPS